MVEKCTRCGCTKIEKGKLQATGRVHFYPEDAKFLKAKTTPVSVRGFMCVDCGNIELFGDQKKVDELTS